MSKKNLVTPRWWACVKWKVRLKSHKPLPFSVHMHVHVWCRWGAHHLTALLLHWESSVKIHKVGMRDYLYLIKQILPSRCGIKLKTKYFQNFDNTTWKWRGKMGFHSSLKAFVFNNPPLVFKLFIKWVTWVISKGPWAPVHGGWPWNQHLM